jgi:hypothetical protein
MKIFRMIGMALVAIIMCTSCSDNDFDSLKSKVIGEWGSYQQRNWNDSWKDVGIIRKLTFYSDGHYIFESVDEETEENTGRTYHDEPYEFNKEETKMYDGTDWLDVIISTKELDESPYKPGTIIFSDDFKRMKFGGFKYKKF